MNIISEQEFRDKLWKDMAMFRRAEHFKMVTGPGRSGAVISVYVSHMLNIPWLPFKQLCPEHMQPLLIVDTAISSGKTLRKASTIYKDIDHRTMALYDEPPRVKFWYEA